MTAIETKEKLKVMTDLAAIRAIAEEWVKTINEASTIEERIEATGVVDDAISAYTTTSRTNCYNAAVASGDAMKYAIREFFYPSIKVKEEKVKDDQGNDTGVIVRSIVDAEKPIDLGDLHKKKGGIGADTKWIYALQKLNYLLTIRAADRVKAEIKKDCFYMDEIAKEIELGKTPTSNTALLKQLQTIVTMMLGEGYHAMSYDVNYLIDVYSNDNKKSKTGITAANHKTLRNYLKKVCYRILTNGKGYDLQQKEIKEGK